MLHPFGPLHELSRARQIGAVLARYGLADVLQRSGIAGWMRRAHAPSTPERVRLALEELGPTFVKLGQLLAGRSDLLPPEWIAELAKLREQATPVPWPELARQLGEDLGSEPERAFAEFEREPVAAASIAQVHRARLHDGTRVAVKVRRPGIRAKVEADLSLLERLAALGERESRELARFGPRAIVRQLSRSLRDELDLATEARHAQRMAELMRPERELVVPRVHAGFTRERLLVSDWLDGPSAGRWLAERPADGAEGARLARVGARIVLAMVFEHGVYHADPHPGNVIFLSDGRLGLVDFGQIGRLSEPRRRELARLLEAIVGRDVEHVVDLLAGWSRGRGTDSDVLALDCGAFVDRYHGLPAGELDLSALLSDIASLVRENDLNLPADVAMLLKAFVTLESLGSALDPRFDMAAQAEPFVARLVARETAPLSLARRAVRGLTGAAAGLPDDLRGLARSLRRGTVRLDIDLERLERIGRDLDHSATRMTLGLVTAALIVGTAIASTVEGGSRLLGLHWLAFAGLVSSLLAGLATLLAIRRSRGP